MRWLASMLALLVCGAPVSARAGEEPDVPRRIEVRVTAFAAGPSVR